MHKSSTNLNAVGNMLTSLLCSYIDVRIVGQQLSELRNVVPQKKTSSAGRPKSIFLAVAVALVMGKAFDVHMHVARLALVSRVRFLLSCRETNKAPGRVGVDIKRGAVHLNWCFNARRFYASDWRQGRSKFPWLYSGVLCSIGFYRRDHQPPPEVHTQVHRETRLCFLLFSVRLCCVLLSPLKNVILSGATEPIFRTQRGARARSAGCACARLRVACLMTCKHRF